jgi:glycosyltransferase involved in cell wall biosynthesis
VRWLGERQDVPQLLAAADVHCQVNARPEPFGIAYVEALAAGLPVVAARSGGAPEIVDASCGILVPPGDSEALAGALERLIAERPFRAALAAGAPARARLLCDPARQMMRLADALSAMAPAHAGV